MTDESQQSPEYVGFGVARWWSALPILPAFGAGPMLNVTRQMSEFTFTAEFFVSGFFYLIILIVQVYSYFFSSLIRRAKELSGLLRWWAWVAFLGNNGLMLSLVYSRFTDVSPSHLLGIIFVVASSFAVFVIWEIDLEKKFTLY